MRIRRSKRIWAVALGVFVAVFLFTFLTAKFKDNEEADAANLGAFDAGYIISDYQMSNYNAMNEAEIQSFLTAKNPCANSNYSYYLQLSANKNYTWHWANGHFVCLSEERFGDGETIGSGDTAAHIIWQAAQDYRINPQVLLVLLQKETGLITDPIPNNGDYRKATGYGCPDTAACSSKYYGFKNQVRNAAALFRTVLDGGWTNYPLGNNYVQYNPNAGCGGSVVNIRSLATSALYRYTPYQPNVAALNAGYGYGDGCSAYGNRNFYSYFEDWFGGITIEAGYVALDTPRYLELVQETSRINPRTGEVVDVLPAGMIRKYDSKIRLISGEWCLRTEYSTSNDLDACVKFSDLVEIKFEYESVPENEQEKIIKNDAKKTRMRSGTSKEVDDFLIRRFTKRVVFQGVTYYITEFDEKNTSSEYGISEDYLELAYEGLKMPGKYVLKETSGRIDPYSGDTYDILEKGRVIEFAGEKVVNGVKFYQTKNNKVNYINASVKADNLVPLEEYGYEKFINPRKMVIKQDIDRTNPYTGGYYDTLRAGMVIDFASKIYLNGQWYYRTKHNTTNNIDAVVPSWAVGEI